MHERVLFEDVCLAKAATVAARSLVGGNAIVWVGVPACES